jgi:hypothetical protein
VNRRVFVGRVTLGAAALCTANASRSAAASAGGLNLHFVGMMGFVGRNDGSFLVATPGPQAHGGFLHRPFLMARRGSHAAAALDMRPAFGVNPSAFDMRLSNERPRDFVYRCLENTSLDIVSGSTTAVTKTSTQMAQMAKIAPGKRVRGDIERWSPTTVSLRGGRLADSAAHPDAGKTWSFGEFRQRLTDAVDFTGSPGTAVRLTSGSEARAFEANASEAAELWLVSAALPREGSNNPRVLEHSHVVFDYLVGAQPIIAECPEATGREVPETELPCVHPSSASLGFAAAETRFPPWSDLCYPLELLMSIFDR